MILIIHSNEIYALGLRSLVESGGLGQQKEIFFFKNFEGLQAHQTINDISCCLIGGNFSLEDITGFKKIRNLTARAPLLLIIDNVSPQNLKRLFSQRLIDGVIMHDAAGAEFITALQTIGKNEVYLGNGIDLNKSRSYHLQLHQKEGANHLLQRLTNRENEIMQEVMRGATSTQIGNKFFLSTYTVKTHRKNIMKKLGVANTLELISFLQAAGVEPD